MSHATNFSCDLLYIRNANWLRMLNTVCEKKFAKCDENASLPILHLSRVELRLGKYCNYGKWSLVNIIYLGPSNKNIITALQRIL